MKNQITLKFVVMIFSSCLIASLVTAANDPVNSITQGTLMMSKEKALFLSKAKMIHLGMTREDVIEILGKPDMSSLIQGKKVTDPVTGEIIEYYLERVSEATVNEKLDKWIMIVLSTEGRVIEVSSKNISFIAQKTEIAKSEGVNGNSSRELD